MTDDGTTKRLRSSKAERLFRKQRGAGSSPVGASIQRDDLAAAFVGVSRDPQVVGLKIGDSVLMRVAIDGVIVQARAQRSDVGIDWFIS